MNTRFLPAVMISFCIACCARGLAANKGAPGAAEPPTTIDVRLLDEDGKPVAGASVGTFAFRWSSGYKKEDGKPYVPDESGWCYSPQVRSDGEGKARLTYKFGISRVVARHVGRALVAVQDVPSGQPKDAVAITLHAQCKIFGQLMCKELQAHGRKITWSNVLLYAGGESRPAMDCISERAEFEFYVPPGTYKLQAYGTKLHDVYKTVTVRPGERELKVEAIDLPPTRLALLEGQPAPEFREVAAWRNSPPIKLCDLRGKVVLLEFWGCWCGPCVGRMPDLFSVYDKYHDQGLAVIGVHVDAGRGIDTVAELDAKLEPIKKQLWKGRDIPFPVALLPQHRVPYRSDVEDKARCQLSADYGVVLYPTCVLIDRRGRVVGQYYPGGSDSDDAILKKALAEK